MVRGVPLLMASTKYDLICCDPPLFFLLAGGVVVVAYSGTEQNRPYSLWRRGKRVLPRLKSRKTGQNISAPRVEKKEEFMKWLADWRVGNQPNRPQYGAYQPRRPTAQVRQGILRAQIATACGVKPRIQRERNMTLRRKGMLPKKTTLLLLVVALCLPAVPVAAQSHPDSSTPHSVSKSVKAVGYEVGGGRTKVDLRGTALMPQANGKAEVDAKAGATKIEVSIKRMVQPSTLGTEFMTYVLWAVSPDGRTSNLGEIITNKDGEGKLSPTTQFQTFSLFVTAEPYFSVRKPSEMLVLENEIRKDTKGKIFVVNDYKLMKRSQYQKMGNPLALTLDLKNVPLEMYEARNAVEIAKSRGADKYAPEIFSKAEASLKMAENSLASKADKKQTVSTARQTVQFSEDARALSVQRQEEERIANERAVAAATAKAEAEAKAAADAADAKRKADEEVQRQAELAAAKEEVLRTREEAARAEAERNRKAAEALRSQLLEQLNRVLETRDTPRGLVVNMGDVLFDTGKFDLRPEAREKLAKLSGIVLAHPGLNLAVEGHTDSVGGDELNQALSRDRAGSVRSYLIEQGLTDGSVSAQGFGKSIPVADNDTAAGRQKNRRVEIIVSGEVIGVKIGL
jgi:outer membrane protein OmpA-like peptidoglycan-associated protein